MRSGLTREGRCTPSCHRQSRRQDRTSSDQSDPLGSSTPAKRLKLHEQPRKKKKEEGRRRKKKGEGERRKKERRKKEERRKKRRKKKTKQRSAQQFIFFSSSFPKTYRSVLISQRAEPNPARATDFLSRSRSESRHTGLRECCESQLRQPMQHRRLDLPT